MLLCVEATTSFCARICAFTVQPTSWRRQRRRTQRSGPAMVKSLRGFGVFRYLVVGDDLRRLVGGRSFALRFFILYSVSAGAPAARHRADNSKMCLQICFTC